MSAVIIVAQRRHGCVHVVTDAAVYRENKVRAYKNKIVTIPNWPGAVTNLGNGAASVSLGAEFSERYSDFDSAIADADKSFPSIVADCGLPTTAVVLLAGISKLRDPETYTFTTDDDLPAHIDRAEALASPHYAPPCRLVRLPDEIMSPVPTAEDSVAAAWEGFDLEADPELMQWQLRKHLTMQRHMQLPDDMGGIGGFGICTTIFADRVEQRVLVRWPEDQLGATLHPAPIDWAQWHRANPKPQAEVKRKLQIVR